MKSTPETILKNANKMLEEGLTEQAIALLQEGTILFPVSAELYMLLGEAHFDLATLGGEKSLKQSVFFCLEKATEIEPNSASYWAKLGWSYYWFGEWEKGKRACARTLELDPENLQAYKTLGLIYGGFNSEYAKAEEIFQKMVMKCPEKAEGYLRLGVLYHKIDRLPEALRMYLKAIDAEPGNMYAYQLIFGFFYDPEWRDIRSVIARKALAIPEFYPFALEDCVSRGEFYAYLGQIENAERLYQATLQRVKRKTFYRLRIEYTLESIQFQKQQKHFHDEYPETAQRPPVVAAKNSHHDAFMRHKDVLLAIWNDWEK